MAESPPSPPESAVARSIGERLLAGRQKTGLTIPAAAEKLHLDPKVIEALEADRFAELGASVYVRGHLKRYAEFVGENAIELLNMYSARERHPAPPDLTQAPHPERRADPRRLITPLAGLGGGAALLVAVWWVLTGSGSGTGPATGTEAASVADPPATQIVPADAAPVTGSPSLMVPAAMTSSTPALAPVIERPTAATQAAVPTKTTEQPRDVPPVRDTRLRLAMTNDSWVEIYDSRGERLFYDVASAGSVHDVTGRGPLRVVLGNAAGVTVEVDGQAREIPDGAIEGDGARFVVNRAGSLARAR